MELIEAKVTAMIVLGFGSLCMGFLPLLFARYGHRQWPILLSVLLCFGAGVLLSTSIIHMLPEIRKSMSKNQEYAELIYCIGFFTLYFIDEIVHFINQRTHRNETNKCFEEHLSTQTVRRRHSMDSSPNYGAITTEPLLYIQRQQAYNPGFGDSLGCSGRSSHQACHVGYQEPCSSSYTGVFGLLAALSVHAILEGLTVGLEKNTSQVLLMLGAVASHKFVVGFCLGAELTQSRNSPCQHYISIIIFSFGSVLGIGIGMVTTDIPNKISKMVAPVLKGLAGGTLLYVTACEVLPRERAKWHKQHKSAGIIQFISVIVGFASMTTLIKCLEV